MATPIILEGKQVGRLRASYLLFKESWRFLSLDREMLWVSPITAGLNLLLLGLVVILVVAGVSLSGGTLSNEHDTHGVQLLLLFLCYVAGAYSLSLGQAAIVYMVSTRMHGGDATLGQGLRAAFSRSGSLLLWSCITSTVGVILHTLSRHRIIGLIVSAILGTAWGILTYFVVPAMVLENKTAFSSIPRSAAVFKQTWGETLVSNFSLGLVFFLAHFVVLLSFVGLTVLTLSSHMIFLFILLVIVVVVWMIVASVVQSTLNAILKTLLYIYATENIVPANFDPELLAAMLQKRAVTYSPTTIIPPVNPVV